MSARRVLRTGGVYSNGVEYVRVVFDVDYSDFTLSFWYKLENCYGNPMVMGSSSLTGKGYFAASTMYGCGINFTTRSSDTEELAGCTVTTPVSHVGKWNFCALVRRGRSLTAYFNDLKSTAEDAREGRSFRFYLLLGYDFNWSGGRGTSRLIDFAVAYKRALSDEEIGKLREGLIYQLGTSGLYWLLDFSEGEGNIAYDKSGHGNHGTIYGARWVVKKALRVLPKAR